MSKNLLCPSASLRGTNAVSDEANQLTEFRRGQSASVTILTDFATLNRLGCRAHIRSLAMTQSVERTHGSIPHNALSPYHPIALSPCGHAFTMAEILLSLTIIGVVAAITLPSLMANINERTWNTQRKALYARLSQAIAVMPQLNGYGEYEGTNTDGVVSATKDTAAEAFLTEGLSKVLKINNICDATHLADCGVTGSFTDMTGVTVSWPTKLSELNSMFTCTCITTSSDVRVNPQNHIDTKAAAFETLNGEVVTLFYNPYCTDDVEGNTWHYSQPKMCANFVYDLNGNKGPNTVGKDIGFVTALYPSNSNVVAPMPLKTNVSDNLKQTEASAACSQQDSESRLPNKDELSAMFYNKLFLGISEGNFWSGSVLSAGEMGEAWYQSFNTATRFPNTRIFERSVRCVKR